MKAIRVSCSVLLKQIKRIEAQSSIGRSKEPLDGYFHFLFVIVPLKNFVTSSTINFTVKRTRFRKRLIAKAVMKKQSCWKICRDVAIKF